MRNFPVGKIDGDNKGHLGVMINRAMTDVLRPFLEKWQVKYRHWWGHEAEEKAIPMDRQQAFPELEEFLEDWAAVRYIMRGFQQELVNVYKLVDVGATETSDK
jgi:hypothetical protein